MSIYLLLVSQVYRTGGPGTDDAIMCLFVLSLET